MAPDRRRTADCPHEGRMNTGRWLGERRGWKLRSSRRFRDLAGAQAPRADTDALDRATDKRPHRLEVWLEAARADIVRVAHLPADNGTLSTNLATLGHGNPLNLKI